MPQARITYPRLKIGAVIGRFNPVHNPHVDDLLRPALAESDYVFVLLGSSKSARDCKNPFKHYVRSALICRCLTDAEISRTLFAPIEDFPYSDTRWQMQCHRQVENLLEQVLINHPGVTKDQVEITLHGVDKDESTWYLELFPQWEKRLHQVKTETSHFGATKIREALYRYILIPKHLLQAVEYEQTINDWRKIAGKHLNAGVSAYLNEWASTEEAKHIAAEWEFIEDYRSQWKNTPYPVIFQTADNVVVHKGHILLIKRKDYPGMGLWALPGGFVKPNQTLRQAAFSELREETTIVFQDSGRQVRVNESWMKYNRAFDAVDRSLRGRTITQAYLWEIPKSFEVEVKADDDAAEAQWFPLEEVLGPEFDYRIFEDHKHIIDLMIKELTE